MAILIVDDEKSIRQILRRVLEPQHTVDEAATADEARRKLAGDPFDLVLCDINLSGESGLDLVRSVAADLGDTAIVMVTGVDDPKVAGEAFEMGVYGYLVKPFTPNEIRITVESALRRRELEQSHARLEERERELRLLSDRERIGRDLHDTVIQRLFSTGLVLQSACALIGNQAARDRVEKAIEELDVIIAHVRSVIFDMDSVASTGRTGLRASVLQLAQEAAGVLGFDPTITFTGPVDSAIATDIGDQLLATLRASLSSVVRHASSRSVEVDVAAAADGVVLRVGADGGGIDAPADLRAGAERAGGALTVDRRPSGGTVLEWRVPLPRLTS